MSSVSRIVVPYENWRNDRIQQGDIFRDVTIVERVRRDGGSVEATQRTITYGIVLSQDCDLEQDFDNRSKLDSPTNDKYLQHILICQAYVASAFKDGAHLEDLNLKMQNWGGPDWKKIKSNQNYRYHYLEAFDDLQIPELVIDFKHYITAPRDLLYRDEVKANYLGTFAELFRENLSTRFAHYLSRVALPPLVEQ